MTANGNCLGTKSCPSNCTAGELRQSISSSHSPTMGLLTCHQVRGDRDQAGFAFLTYLQHPFIWQGQMENAACMRQGRCFSGSPRLCSSPAAPRSIIFLQQTRPCALRAVSIPCVFAPATEIRDFSVAPGLFRFCMNAGVMRNPLVVGTG